MGVPSATFETERPCRPAREGFESRLVGLEETSTTKVNARQPSRVGTSVGFGLHLELVHVGEELGVVARFLEVRDEQLHGFNRRERVEHAAQHEDALQVLFSESAALLCGRELRRYCRRWKIERLFAWLHNFRRMVIRWDHHEANFLGLVLAWLPPHPDEELFMRWPLAKLTS